MSDDDDDWSYSFPPSRGSFSEPQDPRINDISSLDAVNDILAALIAQKNAAANTSHIPVSSIDSKIVIPDDSVLNALVRAEPGTDSYTLSRASFFMTAQAKNSGLGSSQLGGLLAAFNPKLAPANPQTTIKDANSIISKESTNALYNADSSDSSPPLTPASDFRNSIRIWQQQQQQHQSSSDDLIRRSEESRRNNDPNPASPHFQDLYEAVQSPVSNQNPDDNNGDPKVIAYRKGSNRRKQSASYHALENEEKFDSRLYVEEKFKDTNYHYTTMQRNVEFHQIFKSLDLTDRLIDDFACALSREILLQGRIYITEHCIGFNSNLLGWVTSVVIPFDDVTRIDKKSTAGLFPNGIQIETADSKHNFASFISRDSTYDLIRAVWLAATGKDVSELNANPNNKTVGANKQISDYILSIDEVANPEEKWVSDGAEPMHSNDNADVDMLKAEVVSATVRKVKEGSAYHNPGPDSNVPTTITSTYEDSQEETEVINENIECPLGLAFEILFGRKNQTFHKQVLDDQGATEVSEYGDFKASEENPAKLERTYSYRRPLGYSLGPKSTKCCVLEVIEYCDYQSSVVVLSTTVTPDVPSGGSFSVRTRYYLSWGEASTTNLRIAYYVKWTGRSWIKNVVEKLTLAAQTSVNRSIVENLKQEVENNMELVTILSDELTEVASRLERKEDVVKELRVRPIPVEAKQTPLFKPKGSDWTGVIVGVALLILLLLIYSQIKLAGALHESKKLLNKQLELISILLELFVENEDAPWWSKMFGEGRDSRRKERAIFLAKQALLLLEGSQENLLRSTLQEIL